MVGYYEKYCSACVQKFNLKQDENWHKKFHENLDIEKEIENDKNN